MTIYFETQYIVNTLNLRSSFSKSRVLKKKPCYIFVVNKEKLHGRLTLTKVT